MVYEGKIEGRYVYLRSVTADDAEFTLKLRQDPQIERFLPRLDISLEQQRDWIDKQRKKQGDYFFVSCDKNGKRIGTVGIYDMHGKTAEGGRLALLGDAFQNTETSVLLYMFTFETLGLDEVTGFVYADNRRALRFNKSLGCLIGPPVYDKNVGKQICYARTTKESFYNALQKIKKMLYPEN